VPQFIFFQISEIVRNESNVKLILGLHVNIDKANDLSLGLYLDDVCSFMHTFLVHI